MQPLDHQSRHAKSELGLTLSTKHVAPLVENSNVGRWLFASFNHLVLADGWGCGKVLYPPKSNELQWIGAPQLLLFSHHQVILQFSTPCFIEPESHPTTSIHAISHVSLDI